MASEKTKKMAKKTSGIGIRTKLLFWLLLIALVPIVIIGTVGYKLSSSSLEKQSFDSLESTLVLQKKALEDYFSGRTTNIRDLANEISVLQQEQFLKLAAVKKLKKKLVEEYFLGALGSTRTFAASPIHKKALPEFKESVSKARESFHPFFLEFIKNRNFSAMLYLDRSGMVLYSSDESVEPGISIKKYADTPEAEAYGKALKGAGFSDYKQSSLQDDKPTAYFFAPIKNNKATVGVVLLRMKNTGLDAIMKENVALGKSGETYLMGSDGMFRSNSAFFEESTIVNPAFIGDTEIVEKAMVSKSGQEIIVNYRSEYVLSSYVPIKVAGVTWVLTVQINQAETVVQRLKGHESDYLKEYAENNGYPDLYLIDPDGYIFYSAHHQPDYQSNILVGPFSDSLLTDTVINTIESKEMVVSDYGRYAPAGNTITAFIATPLLQDDEVSMIVAVRTPIDQIQSILNPHADSEHEQMHEAATYLIGQDKLWRTESAHADEFGVKTTLLNPKAALNTEAVTGALAGNSGTKLTTNGLGEPVLSSWVPFTFKTLQWAMIRDAHLEEVTKPVRNLLKLLALISGGAVLAVVIASLLVSGGITQQVGTIMTAMAKVEEGDFETRADVISKDELGTMASSFNEMIGTTKSLMKTRQEEHDQLQESIMGLLMEISELSEGDLTVRATVREDATGTVADSLNMMLEELSRAIGNIKKSSEQVGVTANELSSSTDKLSIRSDSQSGLIKGAVEEIKQMTTAIEQAAAQADKSAETSELSTAAATEGTRAVEETSRAMEAIRGNVQDTARAIKRLGESSQEISDFAKTINDISDRTSILALNASIQAAAAGEEGRGFAVVAEEIQRLSERAAGSTRQIETLIKNILGEITDAGTSMDSSIQEVVHGTKLSEDALAKLMDINKRSTEVADLIGAVSSTTSEQAENAVKVAGIMGEIGIISMETADETKATSSSMQGMASVADEMLQSVAIFKLPEDEKEEGEPVETEKDDVEGVSLASVLNAENV